MSTRTQDSVYVVIIIQKHLNPLSYLINAHYGTILSFEKYVILNKQSNPSAVHKWNW